MHVEEASKPHLKKLGECNESLFTLPARCIIHNKHLVKSDKHNNERSTV
jgi:hypothetical protein